MKKETQLKLLNALSSSQKRDGSFYDYVWDEKNPLGIKKQTTFFTAATIYHCLRFTNTLLASKVKQNIISLIKSQASENLTFNYWLRNSAEYKKNSFPDDLDITFLALSALYADKQKNIKGKDFAKIAALLTSLEKDEGGPYCKWITDNKDPGWKDIDIAVNCNIAYFLSLLEINLENIESLIGDRIKSKNLSSPYYFCDLTIIYFISRFYKKDKEKIISKLESYGEQNLNILERAQVVISLINLDAEKKILSSQSKLFLKELRESDNLTQHPFVVEGIKNNNQKTLMGSPTITLAFCIEALEKISSISLKINPVLNDGYCKDIINKSEIFLDSKVMLEDYQLLVKKILNGSFGDEIILLPLIFNEALHPKFRLPAKKIETLSIATLYGWVAYFIYDNIIDGDGGEELLPLANYLLKKIVAIISSADFSLNSMDKLIGLLSEIDNANYLELKNRSIGKKKEINFEIAALKSIGHGIGPLMIISEQKNYNNEKDYIACKNWISHYLLVRQLNDDMHDWEEDLKKGCLNLVSSYAQKNYGLNFDNAEASLEAKQIIWTKVIPEVCQIGKKYIYESQIELEKIEIMQNISSLEKIFDKPKKSIKKTLQEQSSILEFISSADLIKN